jgi:tetratricopeptide (TPR) repeat protein
VHAYDDALDRFEHALRLLEQRPAGTGRDDRELRLVTAALAPFFAVHGFASPRLGELHGRGLELADALGVDPPAPLLRSLAMSALAAGDFERARHYAEQLRAHGERDASGVMVVESDYVLGISAFWQGRFASARRHFEAAVERYRPEDRGTHLNHYGLDPKVVCLSRLANTLWFLGDTAAAVGARDGALALADEIDDPASGSTARVFATMLALELGDDAGLRVFAEELGARPREHEVRPVGTHLEALRAYLEVIDGHARDGIARLRRALEQLGDAEHAPGLRGCMLRVLAAACAAAGDARGGIAACDRLLVTSAAGLWRSEALRLRAELRAELGAAPEEVRAELEQALDVARRQQAAALERRAEASLEALLAGGTLAERSAAHPPLP